jgi:hypothetical protein
MSRNLLRSLMPCAVVGAVLWTPAHALSQVEQFPHWSGQGIAPVYEGYDQNPDGTFNMWFGYMNRNYEETIDLPIGPSNTFEPGGDLGQPTHFLTRRHKDVFGVVVPKDFGDKTLVWTLVVRGTAEKIAGTLNPVWLIDRRRTTRGGNAESPDSNTPPIVKTEPTDQTIALNGLATLRVWATDDGFPRRQGKSVGMTVVWSKYRGPGEVSFVPPAHPSQTVVTEAVTTAKFSEPGSYVLQVVVDDGSGETAGNFGYHCCWTNAQVRVTVQGSPSPGAPR